MSAESGLYDISTALCHLRGPDLIVPELGALELSRTEHGIRFSLYILPRRILTFCTAGFFMAVDRLYNLSVPPSFHQQSKAVDSRYPLQLRRGLKVKTGLEPRKPAVRAFGPAVGQCLRWESVYIRVHVHKGLQPSPHFCMSPASLFLSPITGCLQKERQKLDLP